MQSTNGSKSGSTELINAVRALFQPQRFREIEFRIALRIRLVSAGLGIPIRCGIGEELTLPAEGPHRFLIDFDAQSWSCRDGNVTLNHEVACIGYVFVPGWLGLVPFHGEEVLAGDYRVRAGRVADRGSVAVHVVDA